MIAVDALGGDFAPSVVLQGGLNAAQKGIPIAFFGPYESMAAGLQKLNAQWESLPITLINCTQAIFMDDDPVLAVSYKKDASLTRAMQAVATRECSAFVSAGSSGAALVAACLLVKRLPGVIRPALSVLLPTKNGGRCLLLDVGANVDCKPSYLEQFAYIGAAAAKSLLSLSDPRVALLSNGAEASKGNALTKNTYTMLTSSPLNFVGNIEARYVFDGSVDVIVCDGFVGNVLLKTAQGTARFMQESLKVSFGRSLWSSLLGVLSKQIFLNLKKELDYANYGGGLLLGVAKPVIISHGSSNAVAIEHSILQAHSLVQSQVIEHVAESIAESMGALQHKQPSTYATH